MSEKIVIVGPPEAGKTTLRKIFFEGENPTKLLEYALEPTHGIESIVIKLSKEIGIFDLAGQENQYWLETEKKTIFYNTKVILLVIDVTTPIENLLDFIRKIIEIRNTLTPSSIMYILIHKIDLVSKKKLRELNSRIKFALIRDTQINVLFTSIKKEYFTQTFSFFIDLLKTCLIDEIDQDKLDFNFLKEAIMLLFPIDQEVVISRKDLQVKLNRSKMVIDSIIEHLIRKGHIYEKGKKKISLTDKGKKHFKEILNNFSIDDIIEIEKNFKLTKVPTEVKVPSFIGYFISDKSGINYVTVELEDAAINFFLGKDFKEKIKKKVIDLDLVSGFVSALEQFSQEINIQDLTGLELKGTNLKMQIFSFKEYNVTFFTNPNVNIKPIENKIRDYFESLFRKYRKKFEMVKQTGETSIVAFLRNREREWLKELNSSYEQRLKNLEFYDMNYIDTFNNQLDELYGKINLKVTEKLNKLEKIKKLKVDLMKGVAEDNFDEIKLITKKAQEFGLNFTWNGSL